MKKKLTSILLALAMAVSLLPAMGGTAKAAPIANLIDASTGMAVDYDSSSGLPTGHYYLRDHVTLSTPLQITGNDVWLDLRGHNLIGKGLATIFLGGETAQLNLTDSAGGGQITHESPYDGRGVHIGLGTFNMYGGKIYNNNITVNSQDACGGGVYVNSNAKFKMYGGIIRANRVYGTANRGGGVYVAGGASFNMYGGTLDTNVRSNEYADNVCVDGGSFNWRGGTIKHYTDFLSYKSPTPSMSDLGVSGSTTVPSCYISGSTPTIAGGGIESNPVCAQLIGDVTLTSALEISDYVVLDLNGKKTNRGLSGTASNGNVITVKSGATLILTDSVGGGTITGGYNYVGGGVNVSGTFNMKGGKISNNQMSNLASGSGGGVRVESGTMSLSGNPVISGNKKSSAANNVYLNSGKITIDGTLNPAEPIGVSMESPGVFTDGASTNGGITAANLTNKFVSEQTGYSVVLYENEVRLAKLYTVTWKNDETLLETDENVVSDTKPSYGGETPTKAATAQYTYTFKGWSTTANSESGTAVSNLPAVIEDTTYYAAFSKETRSYTVTWKNVDGTTIDTSTVAYGATPTHAAPTKAATAQYTYTFAGWTPAITAVTGDADYTATYAATAVYVPPVVIPSAPTTPDAPETNSETEPSTQTTTTTEPDGATTTTTVTTDASGETDADVTIEKTVKKPDGTVGTTVSKPDETISAKVEVSEQAVEEADRTGKPVILPVEIRATDDAVGAAPVEITLPEASDPVKVEIPVENLTPGTVAVIVRPDGTEEVVKTSVTSENGVVLTLDGDATVKIIDNTKTFPDVPADEWYADAITWAASREVMNGTDLGFEPNTDTSRGMVAQLLYNLDNAMENGADLFSDVYSGDWYYDSVTWASEAGVIAGFEDGTFRPEENTSREQFAAMLYRYAQHKDYVLDADVLSLDGFADAGSVSDWAETAVRWAVSAGVIIGTEDMSGNLILDPQGDATRAQIAMMLMRFCAKIAE